MKIQTTILAVLFTAAANAQQFPNNEFRQWDKESTCPASWYCNNDADCKGKVVQADKLKGGAKLTIMHCFDPSKEDRSNNVNMNMDDLSLRIAKGKKVKITVDYSYTAIGNDIAYIKADFSPGETEVENFPVFDYNGSTDGLLKAGAGQQMVCYLNFGTEKNKLFASPQSLNECSLNTTFGIMPANGLTDVHKGSTLIVHRIKLDLE